MSLLQISIGPSNKDHRVILLKRYLCGQHRVLIIDGKPCTLVLIDFYRPGEGNYNVVIDGEVVKIGERKENEETVEALMVTEWEEIFLKKCIEEMPKDPQEVLKLIREAYESKGMSLPRDIECVEEQ